MCQQLVHPFPVCPGSKLEGAVLKLELRTFRVPGPTHLTLLPLNVARLLLPSEIEVLNEPIYTEGPGVGTFQRGVLCCIILWMMIYSDNFLLWKYFG